VHCSGHELPTTRAERDRVDVVVGSRFERSQKMRSTRRLDGPDVDRAAAATRREQPAVRAEGEAPYLLEGWTRKRLADQAAVGVPESDRRVRASGREHLRPRGRKGRGENVSAV